MRTCKKCGIEKEESEFRIRNKKIKLANGDVVDYISRVCKKCDSTYSNNRNKANKLNVKTKIVEYKGGKCSACGYNKYIGALDLHHLDPNQKEFDISKKYYFDEDLKSELDKCILLCANCHRELHSS